MKNVTITTDGSCVPHTGRGGWAAILEYGKTVREICGSDAGPTTCNRMETMAAINALLALREPCNVVLRTDSMYVIYAIRRETSKRKTKSNADLVHALWDAARPHRLTLEWVRGHSGDRRNERCDQLALDRACGA